jgi:hypothetical protein
MTAVTPDFFWPIPGICDRLAPMRCALLTIAALIACKDKRPEQPPAPPVPHDGVTLIQAGAAPLRVLRYQLTKGTKTTSELVYDIDARSAGPEIGSGGSAGSSTASEGGPAPTLVFTVDTAVEDVLPDGAAKLRVTVVKSQVRDQPGNPAGGDVLRSQATAADGLAFTQTVAPDGKISDSKLDAPASLPAKARERLDSLIQGLEHVAMQLPSEPIGVGATWKERKPLPAGGIRAMAETTYTLTALTGTTASYTAAGRTTGDAQTIEQDGVKVAVTNARGHSEIKGTLDLAHYTVEVASKATFTADMNVDAPAGTPGAGPSTVEVTVGIQLAPASAAPAEPAPAAQGAQSAP